MKLPNQSVGFSRSFSTQSVLINRQGTGVVPSRAIMQLAAGGDGGETSRGASCRCPCCITTGCPDGGVCMYCC
jgi:hypothetical protein